MELIITYGVYLGLLLFLVILTSIRGEKRYSSNLIWSNSSLKLHHWISLIALCTIVGFRYDVGNDWHNYVIAFEEIGRYAGVSLFENGSYMEWGFVMINRIIFELGGHSTAMFFLVALISWFFLFKSINYKFLPFYIFFIFSEEFFFWSMNGVRQFMAISIFVFSIKFLIRKKILYFILLILLGSLFHTSILITLVLVVIPLDKIYFQSVWISLYLVSFYFSSPDLILKASDWFFGLLSSYPKYSRYVVYAELEHLLVSKNINYGLGYLFKTISTFFIFLVSKSVIRKYPDSKFYFIIFFIGALCQSMFYESPLINRLILYFIFIKAFLLGLTCFFFLNQKQYLISVAMILLSFIMFLTTVYNSSNQCSPYIFSFFASV